jgi:hypothetical protein
MIRDKIAARRLPPVALGHSIVDEVVAEHVDSSVENSSDVSCLATGVRRFALFVVHMSYFDRGDWTKTCLYSRV